MEVPVGRSADRCILTELNDGRVRRAAPSGLKKVRELAARVDATGQGDSASAGIFNRHVRLNFFCGNGLMTAT